MPDVKTKHIEKVISAYNSNINAGHVPTDLINTDVEFWIGLMGEKLCELDRNCDPQNVEFDPNSPECSIIQCAFATTWSTYHYMYIAVEPYDCYEGSGCVYTNSVSGYGQISTSASGTKHTETPWIDYYISDISYVGNYDVSHEVSGTVYVGNNGDSVGPKTGTNSVILSGLEYVNGVSCGSSHD